jgi:hypothetical protein
MKKCSSCKIEKSDLSFYKDKSSKSGLRSNCKDCIKEYKKENVEKYRKYAKKYRDDNKNKFALYYQKNKEEINRRKREDYKNGKRYKRKKVKKSEFQKLSHSIRNTILNSFKRNGYKKISKSYQILGCSFEEFKFYLESKFETWMTWENKGLYNGELNYGWDIDHIIPISSAKSEDEIIRLNHYTNLQPLCSKVNRDIKKDKTGFIGM